jgi:raffinose/stachyose/melibiose transport system substrate-binding protein
MKNCTIRAVFLAIAMTLLGTLAVSAGGKGEKGTTLTAALSYNANEPVHKAMLEITRDYAASHPGINFEVVYYPDYEVTMKTKMAANDLPDLWSTHGWSVARYSEYLERLNNESWASKINPKIKPIVADSNGTIYVLPFNVESQGIVMNRDVLDQAGVDPFSIKTWDDFKAACEKIKAIGRIPLDIAGGASDDWTVGTIYDTVAQSYLVANDRNNYRNALLDGSFDWENWRPVAMFLLEFRDKGYLNPDYTQGTYENQAVRLANGQAAFVFSSNGIITQVRLLNPEGRFGFIPVPSASPDDTPTLITGERFTLGVWKNGPHKAEALKFLEYCSTPEIINRIATLDVTETGLIGAGYESDTRDLKEYFDRLTNIRGFPYFDRAYLPSGMWDALCKTASGLLANTMTMDQALARLRNDYRDLRSQQ